MIKPIEVDSLFTSCIPGSFSFKTTKELKPLNELVGQERGLRSIEFGLDLSNQGYNIFVLGESGTGKNSILRSVLDEKAKSRGIPDDWCYVNNFREPERIRALRLPAGVGIVFKAHMEDLIETLKRDIPKVFESKDYESHRNEFYDAQQVRTKVIFDKLERIVNEKGFILKKSASGLAVLPAINGKAIEDQDYYKMSDSAKAELDKVGRGLQDKLGDAIREVRDVENDTKEKIRLLDVEVTEYILTPLIKELLDKYKEFDEVTYFINEVRDDILGRISDFMPKEEMTLGLPGLKMTKPESSFPRYEVNLFVNNADTKGAPVIFESNPTYYNLFGKVEHSVQYGVATTDFTMIKSGSVQKANGGYLVLNALDVLKNVFVYDALKKIIKNKEVTLEDVWEQYRLISTESLKPEPLPLDLKVILVGDPYIYYILYNHDTEYRKFFKVKSDFDNVMPRSSTTENYYACFIASKCEEHNVVHFNKEAVARIVEFGSRFSGNKDKLTARFGLLEDMVIEAGHWASIENRTEVMAEDVTRAYDERVYRHSKIDDKIKEFIAEDSIMVDTSGEVVGQLNGVAILNPGDYSFGKPSRITAKTYLGEEGIINIESEVKKSGKIYNKAHLIVKSFLGQRFARECPLSFNASVCFEQLYEEIEGDSATCAEYYALASSLSEIPLNQGIAVTGSMNQMGEVQPIGGVNEKIEGFFDVCLERGLTSKNGVIIPRRNVKNLMLKVEVRDAVSEGKFNVYGIDNVDEGLEILTGKVAGKMKVDGTYKSGTINHQIQKKLIGLADTLHKYKRNSNGAVKKTGKNKKKSYK